MTLTVNVDKGIVYIGAAVNLVIPVIDQATKEPLDMTGYSLKWQLRNVKTDASALLTKSSPVITTINGVGATPLTVLNCAKIPLYASDTFTAPSTILIPPGRYYHGLIRTDTGNEILIAEGYFWLDIAGVR